MQISSLLHLLFIKDASDDATVSQSNRTWHIALAVWQRLGATRMEDAACGYVDRARYLAGQAHPASCRGGTNFRHRGNQGLRIRMPRFGQNLLGRPDFHDAAQIHD